MCKLEVKPVIIWQLHKLNKQVICALMGCIEGC